MSLQKKIIEKLGRGIPLDVDEILSLSACNDVDTLAGHAAKLRDQAHGRIISYSPKVFIPLTKLCRDVCHYCTFAQPPRPGQRAYLTAEEVLTIARAGVDAGCHEALFTLGDKPELRYRPPGMNCMNSAIPQPCRTCARWRNGCWKRPVSCPT